MGANTDDRWEAIDELRGFSVLSLIVFNSFYGFKEAPEFITHARGFGYTFADLIAPLFLFAVGLSYHLSFGKRLERDGTAKTLLHFLIRYGVLILFGVIGDCLVYKKIFLKWGTLEMIGLSGIAALPCMFLSPAKKISLAIIFVGVWHMILEYAGAGQIIADYSMGGPYSVFAWSSVVLVASAISELRSPGRILDYFLYLIFIGAGVYILSVLANNVMPPNKSLVNASYIFLSLRYAVLALAFFSAKELIKVPVRILSMLGKNPLLFYMLSGILNLLLVRLLPPALSLPYLVIICVLSVIFFVRLADNLAKKKIYLKL